MKNVKLKKYQRKAVNTSTSKNKHLNIPVKKYMLLKSRDIIIKLNY